MNIQDMALIATADFYEILSKEAYIFPKEHLGELKDMVDSVNRKSYYNNWLPDGHSLKVSPAISQINKDLYSYVYDQAKAGKPVNRTAMALVANDHEGGAYDSERRRFKAEPYVVDDGQRNKYEIEQKYQQSFDRPPQYKENFWTRMMNYFR